MSDRYLGSGNWIKKHPARDRLKREIVGFFASSAEVYAAEAELVTWNMVFDNPLCMNQRNGGEGSSIETMLILHADPEYRASRAAGLARMAANPAWQKRHSAFLAGLAADPEWLENVRRGVRRRTTPEWREANAAAMRSLTSTPEWLDANAARNRLRATDPEWIENNLVQLQRMNTDPAMLEKRAAIIRRVTATPEWREANAAAMRRTAADPEWRRNVADGAAKRAKDPKWIANHAAAMRLNGANQERNAKISAASFRREAAKRAAKALLKPPCAA